MDDISYMMHEQIIKSTSNCILKILPYSNSLLWVALEVDLFSAEFVWGKELITNQELLENQPTCLLCNSSEYNISGYFFKNK